ncbi:transposase [Dyadobacter subterraneus]|uniref:Transposase n=1 Tax=Dyadobacter subterraneus TaxID=2773304 RepID=A0ABR9WP67_9BACT|nr:transposase [Dyadobacter subterraneus]MBE9466651.1 transposase [Dyadobacter subterraneus]
MDDRAASDDNPARRPPKSPLGQAIAYTLPRWEGLTAYALHGQIEIDNNLAENVIRPLAIGYA